MDGSARPYLEYDAMPIDSKQHKHPRKVLHYPANLKPLGKHAEAIRDAMKKEHRKRRAG